MGECKRVLRFDTYLFFSLCVCSRNGIDCHELGISVILDDFDGEIGSICCKSWTQ